MPQRVSISAATLPTPPIPTIATCTYVTSPARCLFKSGLSELWVCHCQYADAGSATFGK